MDRPKLSLFDPQPQAPAKLPPLGVHLRWMIRRDFAEVVAIENASFDWCLHREDAAPWSEADFIRCLKQHNVMGMVAEALAGPADRPGRQVVGFFLYELQRDGLDVLNLAVDPHVRRREVGLACVNKLKSKVELGRRRHWLRFVVRERNLPGQLFLKACGLRCVRVLPNHYPRGESGYVFKWRCGPPAAVVDNLDHRLSEYLAEEHQRWRHAG